MNAPWLITLLGLLLLAAGGLVLWTYQRGLGELRRAAERFAAGDLSRKVVVRDLFPLGSLGRALNRMAEQMEERYQAAVQQRLEMEAVLSSMVEGVVVVDPEAKLISLNAAAGELLGVDPDSGAGRPIGHVTRHLELQRLIERALAADEPVQEALALEGALGGERGPRHLKVQGAPMRDAGGRRLGAVIVLHDVSEMVRLEGVRRDFVANVSHELKTPVTAIKGFAETLHEAADHRPEDARRFLEVIIRQADRLEAIVADLLTLASIEQGAGERSLDRQRVQVGRVLEAAAESCQFKAEARDMRFEITLEPELAAEVEATLIEQAVINLLDNAIKYSPDGSSIHLSGCREGEELVLSVRDEGCGIEARHQSRLFERFYRTDRARSRDMGGTGLGLAIVKHVAQVHDGRVSVQSRPGHGSTFRIHLPAAEREAPRGG